MPDKLLRKITPSDHRVMPWKNGLGTTREIAIDPPGATMSDAGFRWRLSIADVAQSGPFSSFPGIDRTIMVIKGSGMVLNVVGRPPQRLDRCFVPYEFSGDAATECELIDGPIQDFNLMVNRSLLSARTEVRALTQDARIALADNVNVVHLLSGRALIRCRSEQEEARAGDTLLLHPRADVATMELIPHHAMNVALIAFHENG